jgi:NADH-quinone oxidoreductase subunit N
MAAEMRVVFGLSGAFILFYVVIGGPLIRVAEAAARSFY